MSADKIHRYSTVTIPKKESIKDFAAPLGKKQQNNQVLKPKELCNPFNTNFNG